MKTLIAGTFDNFHVGHQWLIWQAFSQTNYLVIIIARDKTVRRIKGQAPKNTEKKRLNRVQKEVIGYNNIFVRLGRSDGDFEKTINEENPSQILIGYDQKFSQHLEKKFGGNLNLERITPYKPEFFKSSKF